jgi:hypothetical protein
MRSSSAIRSVAVLEAFKGVVVMLAGCGLLSLVHRNLQDVAANLILHAHLNPASHYPSIFLDTVRDLTNSKLWRYSVGATAALRQRSSNSPACYRHRKW